MKTLIVVLAFKRNPDGSMHQEHRARCHTGYQLVEAYGRNESVLILTGGKVRKDYPPDAWLAQEYFARLYDTDKKTPGVFLVDTSLTTPQDIIYTRDLVKKHNIAYGRRVFVGGQYQLPKMRVLVKKLWPDSEDIEDVYVAGSDSNSYLFKTLHRTVGVWISRIDPEDKWLLWPFKKIFRNG